jgi:hypothetical protein
LTQPSNKKRGRPEREYPSAQLHTRYDDYKLKLIKAAYPQLHIQDFIRDCLEGLYKGISDIEQAQTLSERIKIEELQKQIAKIEREKTKREEAMDEILNPIINKNKEAAQKKLQVETQEKNIYADFLIFCQSQGVSPKTFTNYFLYDEGSKNTMEDLQDDLIAFLKKKGSPPDLNLLYPVLQKKYPKR